MSVILKLIVVLLGVVNLFNISFCLENSDAVLNIEERISRYGYTYTPNIGAHKVHTQATNWNLAWKICKEEGGHLAVINSAAESELIARLVANSGSHNGSADSNYVHIGFHDLFVEGQYVTVTGESIEEVGFNAWVDGEPNNGGGNENCGSMRKNGKLNDVGCVQACGFVCELPYAPSAEKGVIIRPTQQRPVRRDDYTYTPNIGAHKVHTQATNWNSAWKICKEEGGHLAVINSGAESELIARLFANSGSHNGSADSNYVHIGFHDLFVEGQYVTVTGESIEEVGFNEWIDGEPNNGKGNENCGSMQKNGKLNDVGCVQACGFVCELPYLKPDP